MDDLSSRFIASRGEPIEVEGRLVHMSYVVGPSSSRRPIGRMRPSGELEQGIGFRTDNGWLLSNGEKAKKFSVWADTAPDVVSVELRPLRGREQLAVRIWNIWKSTSWGSTMAWIGNAGMVVETIADGRAVLGASVGPGSPRFDELVIDLEFAPDVKA